MILFEDSARREAAARSGTGSGSPDDALLVPSSLLGVAQPTVLSSDEIVVRGMSLGAVSQRPHDDTAGSRTCAAVVSRSAAVAEDLSSLKTELQAAHDARRISW